MKISYLFLIFCLVFVFTTGCQLSEGDRCLDARCGDELGDFVDPIVTVIGGALDDQSASLYAAKFLSVYASIFNVPHKSFFVSEAWAAACARPSTAACVTETKTAEYNSCVIGDSAFVFDGSVTMTYAGTANCGFTAVGDTVTRTMDMSRTIPDDGTVRISGDEGGTKLTITGDSAFNLDIFGVRKIIHNNANIQVSRDIFMRTTSPITITGGLARDTRIINGGALEISVSHGILSFIPTNLAYSTTCCYPISGSVKFTRTGDDNSARTGTITFPLCGTATIQWDSKGAGSDPYDVSLVSCE